MIIQTNNNFVEDFIDFCRMFSLWDGVTSVIAKDRCIRCFDASDMDGVPYVPYTGGHCDLGEAFVCSTGDDPTDFLPYPYVHIEDEDCYGNPKEEVRLTAQDFADTDIYIVASDRLMLTIYEDESCVLLDDIQSEPARQYLFQYDKNLSDEYAAYREWLGYYELRFDNDGCSVEFSDTFHLDPLEFDSWEEYEDFELILEEEEQKPTIGEPDMELKVACITLWRYFIELMDKYDYNFEFETPYLWKVTKKNHPA